MRFMKLADVFLPRTEVVVLAGPREPGGLRTASGPLNQTVQMRVSSAEECSRPESL